MKQKRYTLNGYLLEKKGLLFVFAFTTLFLAIVAPLKSYIMQWLLDAPNKESAMLNLIKGLIIVLLSHILEWISRMSFTKMVCQACQQIRNMIMLRQTEKEMQTYLSENSGDILSALTNDMRVIYDEYYMSVFNIFMWGSMMSVALFMIASISPILLAVSLILGSAPLIVPRVLAKKMGRLREEYSQKMANYTIKVNELLKGFETLMLSNAFFYLSKNHNRVSEEVFEGEYRTQSMLNTTMVISSFISWIPNIMVLLFGVLLVYDGKLTMGYLVTAHTLSNFVISPARMVSDAYAKLKAAKKIKEKLETIMNVKEHSSEVMESRKLEDNIEANDILIKNLSFSYPSTKTLALKNITMKFNKNEKIALVGMSGSGKSSISKLICKYFTTYKGGNKIKQSRN